MTRSSPRGYTRTTRGAGAVTTATDKPNKLVEKSPRDVAANRTTAGWSSNLRLGYRYDRSVLGRGFTDGLLTNSSLGCKVILQSVTAIGVLP